VTFLFIFFLGPT